MARPADYPPPGPSKSTYVAIRDEDGEIVWDKMRIDRPLPCYLHPEWAAPETKACLHPHCIQNSLHPHNKGLIGNRLRILQAGYKLRGETEDAIAEDIALEMLHRYRKIDVPVNHTVGSFLAAIEACGVRRWGWACWEPDWTRGAGRTALEDSIEDVTEALDRLQQDAFNSMGDPFTHDPERALQNLQLAAATSNVPPAIFGYLLGELTTADMVRLGISNGTVGWWTTKLRKVYLEAYHV